MPLVAGQILQNRYRVESLLGQGGMGAVYRVWDLRLDSPQALKEMIPQPGLDEVTLVQFRTQFRQEAMVLARLVHPNLVPVTDYFEERGNAYLVMAFVEGENLSAIIKRQGALPEAQVVAWGMDLLRALAYCHARGIIHRDIKPQNVIITPDGRPVLVDFGLAKVWDPANPQTMTVMRGMGTPEYAPPEQWGAPGRHTDPRSDLYSLGAALYHALTGQAPPTASERMAYPAEFKTPRELTGRVSLGVDLAIERAMALACNDRWPDAAAMAEQLSVASRTPGDRWVRTGTERMPAPPPSTSPPRRLGGIPVWGVALGAVTLVGLLALGYLGVRFIGPLHPPTAAFGTGAAPTAIAPTDAPSPTAVPPASQAPVATATTEPAVVVTAAKQDTPAPADVFTFDSWVRSGDMRMVYVPGGKFAMGSMSGDDDEQPVHTVTVDGFWLDQTEVTNAQFAAYLNDRRGQVSVASVHPGAGYAYAAAIEQSAGTYRPLQGYEDHPVIAVSWEGGQAYCRWVGMRLPTEAEWELAARGREARIYPFGDIPRPRVANCAESECADGFVMTAPVGSFPEGASWVGALDMAGNVWEWVADLYRDDYYSISPPSNPQATTSGVYHVLRGGGWGNDWYALRASYRRNGELPDDSLYGIGFRCAMEDVAQ